MATLNKTSCCGLRECTGLTQHSDPKDALLSIGRTWFFHGWTAAFILFTCPTKNKIGRELINYIKQEGLGSITESPLRKNPNSGNVLRVFVWGVNTEAYGKWMKANSPQPEQIEVGMRVRGNEAASTVYGITGTGWEGIVTSTYDDGTFEARGNNDVSYGGLEPEYFEIIRKEITT